MSDDFRLDIKRNASDFPAFIEGKRVGVNERGEPFIVVGDRQWVLAPNEVPLEAPKVPEQFQLFPPPPRQVTLLGRLTLLLGSGIPGLMLLGGIFVSFGMTVICLVVGPGAIDTYAVWRENGKARITKIEESDFSVNDARVYAYSFSGQDTNGNEVSGVSYQFRDKFSEGQTVPLQKTWFFGRKWKLEGANFTKSGGFAGYFFGSLIFIFPIVGVNVVFFGVVLPGLKCGSLLVYGEMALASFVRQESTGTSVNDRHVQKLVFQFATPDGEQHEASLRTLDPDKFLSNNRRNIVFYNPDTPQKNMVWDSVSSMMKFDEFQQRFTGFTINILIFPVFFAIFCFQVVWLFHNVTTGNMFF